MNLLAVHSYGRGLTVPLEHQPPTGVVNSSRAEARTKRPRRTHAFMFGFLKPTFRNVEYRQAYARCCSMQHLEFGVSSLTFLSYEAVLLYLLTVESGLSPGPPSSTPTCCRLRTSSRLRTDPDSASARFAAAFGVLLGLIKLDDDRRDEGRLISRFAHWLLSRKQTAVRQVFTEIDDQFETRVAGLINEHLKLESNWQTQPLPLAEYAEPTAKSFGYLFSLAVEQCDGQSELKDVFRQIGESLGFAILAFDCANDFYQDREQAQFNPLKTAAEIETALDLACEKLDQAAWLCEQHLSEASLCARVIASVFNRTAGFAPRANSCRKTAATWKKRLGEWGLHKEPGYVYARFDCCCELCCDGAGEAAGCCAGGDCAVCGGGEAAACSDCGCCVCDGCCCDCDGDSKKGNLEQLLGEHGWSRSALKPNGVVLIDGQRHRARAEEYHIPANVEIQVVDVVRSTLIVRELEDSEA